MLFFQAFACFFNVLIQIKELLFVQVTILGIVFQPLVLGICSLFPSLELGLHIFLCLLLIQEIRSIFLSCALLLEHLIDHVGDVTRLVLLLHDGPLLHDGVLQFDSQLILSQLLCVGRDITAQVVVEDVIKSQRHVRLEQLRFHPLFGLSEILPAQKKFLKLLIVQHKARHSGAANEVSICLVFNHERPVVDQCATA